jgi:hypothetical protein
LAASTHALTSHQRWDWRGFFNRRVSGISKYHLSSAAKESILSYSFNDPLEPMTESENAQQLANHATKSLELHRPDKELGDLD